jgi:hypothetical protein
MASIPLAPHVGATVTQLVCARPLGTKQIFPFFEVEPRPSARQSNQGFVRRPPECAPVESRLRAPPARVRASRIKASCAARPPRVRASRIKVIVRLPACKISSAVLARNRGFARSDEFSLESATKARHRGDHRRRDVSRHTPVSQPVRVAPKAPQSTDAITSSYVHLKSAAPQEHASRAPRWRQLL